jgi:phenylalanyl-tRNA synthetase beta chain
MRISLNWLRDYIDLDVTVEQLVHDLTMLGLEIESVDRPGAEIQNVLIGQILSIEPHPEADKIVVCKTDVGGEAPLQICCGAKNMKVGDKVPTAVEGSSLPGGFKIGRRKMRGIESQGMMCSARELGLGEEHDGLLILSPDTPVGGDAKALLGLDDVILEIEVTPNRGDWASMLGVARELSARYQTTTRISTIEIRENTTQTTTITSVAVDAPDLCPRYLGRVLTGVQVGPSPAWLTQRLIAAGMRPINNVVDITNYVLLETGQPLHAFDLDRLAENRIVVRRASGGERIRTLDDQDRALQPDMLVIADAKQPQCVAGVMGGADSEVTAATTRIFLESAYFQPASVRKTSRSLGLVSESSQRFQRGADPEMAVFALNRAAGLLQQLAGAEVTQGVLDQYPQPLPQRQVTLRFARTEQLLGTPIPADEQVAHMERLGFPVVAKTGESATFAVPTWRPDVSMETDLIEEVARLHGFDALHVSLPRIRKTDVVLAPQEAQIRGIRAFLVAQGLTEAIHWTFCNDDDARKAGLSEAECASAIRLQNPLSERHATLRPSLLPALLGCVAHNVNHGQRNVAVFEIGHVFEADPQADNRTRQRLVLGIALSGEAGLHHWSQPARSCDFYDIKGQAEALLGSLHLTPAFEATVTGTFQPGQCAQLLVGKAALGTLGKVNNTVLRAHGLEQEIYLLELDLSALLDRLPAPGAFTEIPAFPPSLRDLAVLVDSTVPAGDLVATAHQAGGKLLSAAAVFDIYTGKPIPEGKKSVALSLAFQSPERTLTDQDTDKSIQKILRQLESNHGATLR